MAEPSDLHGLSSAGDLAAVTRLLAAQPSAASVADGFGRIPLHRAASSAAPSAELLEALAGSGSVRAQRLVTRNCAGLPPLLCARSAIAVRTLCLLGANVSAAGPRGETLLHLAVSEEIVSLSLLRAAIAAGCDVTARDANGKMAIHVAAASGHTNAINSLLSAGAAAAEGSSQASAVCARGLSAAVYALLAWCHEWRPCGDRDRAFASSLSSLLSLHGGCLPPSHPAVYAALASAVTHGARPPIEWARAHGLLGSRAVDALLSDARARGVELAAADLLIEMATEVPASAAGQASPPLAALAADVVDAAPAVLAGALLDVAAFDWRGWCVEHAAAIAAGSSRAHPMARALVAAVDRDLCFGTREVRHVTDASELRALLTPAAAAAAAPSPPSCCNVVGLPAELIAPLRLGARTGRTLFDADLYVAGAGAGSYGWHYDAHDALLVCVAGLKSMRVAAPGALPGETTSIAIDATLQPGDAVFVPAGTYHCGCGGDELGGGGGGGEASVLLSLGLRSSVRRADALTASLRRDGDLLRGVLFFATSPTGASGTTDGSCGVASRKRPRQTEARTAAAAAGLLDEMDVGDIWS